MTSLSILIFGGHGKVAQHLTRHALAAGHTVYSVLRQEAHLHDLPQPDGKGKLVPVQESIEAASVSTLSTLLGKYAPDVVVWSAGAGGKGGPERTRAVDFEGAKKVFDALQASGLTSSSSFRRLVMVSAIDTRDLSRPPPAWYTPEDLESSKRGHAAIPFYYEMKFAADQDLSKRAFPWFILRPSALKDGQGTGNVSLGAHTRIGTPVRHSLLAWDLNCSDTD